MIRNLHSALVEEIRLRKPEYLTESFSVAEIYQNLIPYRTHRDALGVEMNADYEDALLRLLAGEGDLLILESEAARQEIRDELDTGNPNTSYYREYAAAAVRLNPAHLSPESLAAMLAQEPDEELESVQDLEETEPFHPGPVVAEAEPPAEEPKEVTPAPPAFPEAPQDEAPKAEVANAEVPDPEVLDAEVPDAEVPGEGGKANGDAISPEEFFMAARATGHDEGNGESAGQDGPSTSDEADEEEEISNEPMVAELIGMGFDSGISMEGGMTLAETLMSNEDDLTPQQYSPPKKRVEKTPDPEDEVAVMDQEKMATEVKKTVEVATVADAEVDESGRCDSCSSPLPDREVLNFCPFCGLDLRVFPCGSCGESIEFGWKFCVACGKPAAPAAQG